jgi:hypothetical protein
MRLVSLRCRVGIYDSNEEETTARRDRAGLDGENAREQVRKHGRV